MPAYLGIPTGRSHAIKIRGTFSGQNVVAIPVPGAIDDARIEIAVTNFAFRWGSYEVQAFAAWPQGDTDYYIVGSAGLTGAQVQTVVSSGALPEYHQDGSGEFAYLDLVGTFEISYSVAEERVSFTRYNPLLDEDGTSYGYPQEGYFSQINDPDDGNPYPYKNGPAYWLLHSGLRYYEVVPDGTAWTAKIVLNGTTIVESGVTSGEWEVDYLLHCALSSTRSNGFGFVETADCVVTAEYVASGVTVPVNFTPWTTDNAYCYVEGDQGDVTAGAKQPPYHAYVWGWGMPREAIYTLWTFTQSGGAPIIPSNAAPDIVYDVHGRTPLLGGGNYPGTVKTRATWDGWELDPISGYPMHYVATPHNHSGGVHEETVRLENATLQATNYHGVNYEWIIAGRNNQTFHAVYYDHAWLATEGIDVRFWRCLGQDPWSLDSATIALTGEQVEDFSDLDVWTAASGTVERVGSVTKLHSPGGSAGEIVGDLLDVDDRETLDLSQHRHLDITAGLTVAGTVKAGFTERVYNPGDDTWEDHEKVWHLSLTTSTTAHRIDLCAPDEFLSTDVDMSDWGAMTTEEALYQQITQLQSPMTETDGETTIAFVPHRHRGVGKVKQLRFYAIPAGETLSLEKMETVIPESDDHIEKLACVAPHLLLYERGEDAARSWADYDATLNAEAKHFHPEGARTLQSIVEGREALDLPYAAFDNGNYKNTGHPTQTQGFDRLDALPGWSVSSRATDPTNDFRHCGVYEMGDLSPVEWGLSGGAWSPVFVFDKTIQSGLALKSHLRFDLFLGYPAMGHPQEGYALATPWFYVSFLRGQSSGMTVDKDTGAIAPGITVSLKLGSTPVGAADSDLYGHYRIHSMKPGSEYTVFTGDAEATIAGMSGRGRWCALIGAAPEEATLRMPIEYSALHRRVYLAKDANKVRTLHSPGLNAATLSVAHSAVEHWVQYLQMDRCRDLLLVGKLVAGGLKLYRSPDHGLTITEALSMTGKMALAARSGLDREQILLRQDNDNKVWVRRSTNLGQSWGSETACQYSGSQLTTDIYDLIYEPRRKVYQLTCSVGSGLLESKDNGITWTQVALP